MRDGCKNSKTTHDSNNQLVNMIRSACVAFHHGLGPMAQSDTNMERQTNKRNRQRHR